MRIQELADKMGLTIHTIRFYEKEGLLDARHVRRESNNYRNYSEEAVERKARRKNTTKCWTPLTRCWSTRLYSWTIRKKLKRCKGLGMPVLPIELLMALFEMDN
ncbi:MAG: MerR family DNA-binding transcriptional regulator [Paenibacillus macerans]|uniref:MerR family transcriptional regulator n=1 Tax=Paenibacillus TaxID=44249 RepID=UPI000EC8B16D|nr:MerR family transcriptional regulator [Paenibacillus macerans]MDU7474870.1 MerR family DNA-binding transcriptional regulator [Paenibacillus macerans]MEC0137189.1 MerR family DNA-binding transcriptional regulator [Paenibacillus macerans]GBK63106.1 hypothetical protein PbDSM24746_31100 [Paenibacillus macerans]GBK69419.1 hypothetical protein PbJCM17693_31270 [Paenibacillus macerans]